MKPDQNSKLVQALEAKLSEMSQVTAAQSFPTWDELSARAPKYPDLDSSTSSNNILAFPRKHKVWLGGGLLAAASLAFVFFLSHMTSHDSEEISLASAKATAPAVASSFEALKGSVVLSKGQAFFTTQSSLQKIPATKGAEVAIGVHFYVEKGGSLDLSFPNQAWIRLTGDTELEVLDSKEDRTSTVQILRVIHGKVLVMVGKLKKESIFQISSGELETTVRGTTFSVTFDGKNNQLVSVKEGSVSVKSKESPETVIEKGQQISLSDKTAPQITEISQKEEKEMKALQTQVTLAREADLYLEYSRLELVRMEDGTEHRGVILGQTETHLQLKSAEGVLDIPIGKIIETEKIR
jgi:hypothetical protein